MNVFLAITGVALLVCGTALVLCGQPFGHLALIAGGGTVGYLAGNLK